MDNTARSIDLVVEEIPTKKAKDLTPKRAKSNKPIKLKKRRALRHVIYPSYRSQFISLLLFSALGALAIAGDGTVPGLVINRAITHLTESEIIFTSPPLAIPPALVLIKILFSIYNYKFVIDKNGLESQEGLLWLSLRQPRLRFEDIKGIEVTQSLLQRFLGVGDIRMGSAAVGREEGEVRFRGVSNPRKIQKRIQRAIDNRKGRLLRKNARASLEQALEKI